MQLRTDSRATAMADRSERGLGSAAGCAPSPSLSALVGERRLGSPAVIWAAVCLLVGLLIAPISAVAAETITLTLSEPYREQEKVLLDFKLQGLFDDKVMAALDSGLPATLLFEWQVWRDRDGWWDSHIDNGQARYRVFFDVLEECYDVFDGRGRSLGRCRAFDDVEGIVCERTGLPVTSVDKLDADEAYYVEMIVRLAPLEDEEFRDLEGWLDDDGGGVLSWVSQQTVGMFKGTAGLSDRSFSARTRLFRGWR